MCGLPGMTVLRCDVFLSVTATTEIYTYGQSLSLHDALPIFGADGAIVRRGGPPCAQRGRRPSSAHRGRRSEQHTSELKSLMRISYAVFCLKKKKIHSTLRLSSHSFGRTLDSDITRHNENL